MIRPASLIQGLFDLAFIEFVGGSCFVLRILPGSSILFLLLSFIIVFLLQFQSGMSYHTFTYACAKFETTDLSEVLI